MARSRAYGNGSRSASSGTRSRSSSSGSGSSRSYSSGTKSRSSSSGSGSRSYSSGTRSRSASSGSGSKSYSTTRESIFKTASPAPAPAPAKGETTYYGRSDSGGFSSSVFDGFNWGIGREMGTRFVEAIFGPRTIKQEIALPKKVEVPAVSAKDDSEKFKDYTESCSISYKAFQDCLYEKGNNLSKCHIFMDSLFDCKKNSENLRSLNF